MGSFITAPSIGERVLNKINCSHEHYTEKCMENSLQSDFIRRSLYYTNKSYQYYIGQLGTDNFFELYMDLCGIEVYDDNSCDFIWKKLVQFLGAGYLDIHLDILTSKLFVEKTDMCYIQVVLEIDKNEEELDHVVDMEKTKMCEFAKLATEYLVYPPSGEHVFCTIEEGDSYTSSFIKFPFMKAVFDELRISTKSFSMSTTQARLKSFKRFEEEEIYDSGLEDFVQNMVEAGLYRTTNKELTQCFECGGLVSLGKRDFDPWEMHAKKHPCCPYMKRIKGQYYIDKMRRKWRRQVKIESTCILRFENRVHGPDINNDDDGIDNDDSWTDGSDYYSD